MLHSAPAPTVPLDKPPKSISAYDLHVSAEELESLKQAFRMFDSTGAGSIPLSQFKEIINKLNIATDPVQIDLIARSVDMNNDHVIDFEEFATAMIRHFGPQDDDVTITTTTRVAFRDQSSRRGSRQYQDDDHSDLMDCFQEFDKNRDGLISQAELEEVMISLGERLSPHEIKAMMVEADANKDGFIDFEEFKNLLPK